MKSTRKPGHRRQGPAAGAFLATSYKPLLIVVVSQQLLLLDQSVPWVRPDGYHIVSDLIGVSDLFARIQPMIASMLPGRDPDPRQRARAMGACRCHDLGPHHPGRARRARGHDRPQCPQPSPAGLAVAASPDELTGGVCIGSVVEVLGGAIGTVMRLLPLAGITLSHLLLCRRMGTSLALRRARVDLTPTIDGEKNPHPSAVRFLTTSRVRQQTRSQPGHDLKRACEGSRARLRPAPQTHQRQPGPDPGPR